MLNTSIYKDNDEDIKSIKIVMVDMHKYVQLLFLLLLYIEDVKW